MYDSFALYCYICDIREPNVIMIMGKNVVVGSSHAMDPENTIFFKKLIRKISVLPLLI